MKENLTAVSVLKALQHESTVCERIDVCLQLQAISRRLASFTFRLFDLRMQCSRQPFRQTSQLMQTLPHRECNSAFQPILTHRLNYCGSSIIMYAFVNYINIHTNPAATTISFKTLMKTLYLYTRKACKNCYTRNGSYKLWYVSSLTPKNDNFRNLGHI